MRTPLGQSWRPAALLGCVVAIACGPATSAGDSQRSSPDDAASPTPSASGGAADAAYAPNGRAPDDASAAESKSGSLDGQVGPKSKAADAMSDAHGDAASSAATDGSTGWRPAIGDTWQWQLSGTLDTSLSVAVYDIDMFTNDATTIAGLHARGVRVICYVDVGTLEPGRPDDAQFPASVLGNSVQGWPGEYWLDVTSPNVKTLMQSRFELAAQKGCDGVEPDNVDGYSNDPGFPTTAAQQVAYDQWVASAVHALGMAVALKNDRDQIGDLLAAFDFALDEQCVVYSECDLLAPFIQAGKAVFEVEYGDSTTASSVCPQAKADHFDTIIKDMSLDAWRISCE